MKTFLLSTLFIIISTFLKAQINNTLFLKKGSSKSLNNEIKKFKLPKQMVVNWYDTAGNEHNEDKVLLFAKDDTLYFDVPQNDSLLEAIAYNQIEFLRVVSVDNILLIPVATFSSIIFAEGAIGAVLLIGYGLSSSYNYGGPYLLVAGLAVAAIDIPIYFITKVLWNGTRMTYKTDKWKLLKR